MGKCWAELGTASTASKARDINEAKRFMMWASVWNEEALLQGRAGESAWRALTILSPGQALFMPFGFERPHASSTIALSGLFELVRVPPPPLGDGVRIRMRSP
ncbi:MAG: hypothetical protein Rubg2KO_21750 [Rubricoccaceae bacterium]